MYITVGDFSGCKVSAKKIFRKNTVILNLKGKGHNAQFSLPDDLAYFKVLNKEITGSSAGGLFGGFILLMILGGIFSFLIPYALAVAFIIWVCWLIGQKKETKVTASLELKSGQKFSAVLNDNDWKILQGFITG